MARRSRMSKARTVVKTAHRASRAVLGMSTRVIMRARSEVRFSWGMGSLPGGVAGVTGGGRRWGMGAGVPQS
ncbi:hypothetical protein GCM10009603_52470 [Nocardiopsis exhalans]